jgi:hypothetical protein
MFVSSLNLASQQPDYTIYNSAANGVSLIYDTLNEMGYNAEPEFQILTASSNTRYPRIVIEPTYYYYGDSEEKRLADFVSAGGNVIYLCENHSLMKRVFETVYGAREVYGNDSYTLYSCADGEVLIGPASGITNAALMRDRRAGYYTADVLSRWGVMSIFINEAYHGFSTDPGFWDAAPVNIKTMAYHVLVITVLVLLYLGKRFGKFVPYYEELEREENEYLKALANVYLKAGSGYIIYEADLERFLKKCAQRFGIEFSGENRNAMIKRILTEWKKRELAFYDDFAEILTYSQRDFKTKKRSGRRRLYKARQSLDRLEKCL